MGIKRSAEVLFFGMQLLVSIGCGSDPAPFKPSIPNDALMVNYGRELVHGIAACGICHGETVEPGASLSGGRTQADRFGGVAAANLTTSPNGIGGWSVDQIMNGLRGAVRPDGNGISKDLHGAYEWMSDQDAIAIALYLKSTPPVDSEVPRRELDFWERNTVGLFQRSGDNIEGHVPSVDRAASLAFGRYLTDHVAACGTCHNGESSALEEAEHLGGGKTVVMGTLEKVAPEISGSKKFGIGNWSEEQLMHYLRNGETPDGRQADSRFCPVGFYAEADDEYLRAIAAYLLSVQSPG